MHDQVRADSASTVSSSTKGNTELLLATWLKKQATPATLTWLSAESDTALQR